MRTDRRDRPPGGGRGFPARGRRSSRLEGPRWGLGRADRTSPASATSVPCHGRRAAVRRSGPVQGIARRSNPHRPEAVPRFRSTGCLGKCPRGGWDGEGLSGHFPIQPSSLLGLFLGTIFVISGTVDTSSIGQDSRYPGGHGDHSQSVDWRSREAPAVAGDRARRHSDGGMAELGSGAMLLALILVSLARPHDLSLTGGKGACLRLFRRF